MSDFYIDEANRHANATTLDETIFLYDTFEDRKDEHFKYGRDIRRKRRWKKKERDIKRKNARKKKYDMYDA